MAKIKLYLDTRYKAGDTYPLKLNVSHNRSTALINLGIDLEAKHWDATTQKVIGHPQKALLNNFARLALSNANSRLLELTFDGSIKNHSTAKELRDELQKVVKPDTGSLSSDGSSNSIGCYFHSYLETQPFSEKTKVLYTDTLKKLTQYDNDFPNYSFSDISNSWVEGFENYMRKDGLKTNTRALHHRLFKAVINHAIRNDVTTNYPYRHFKIKSERTESRALRPKAFRELYYITDEILDRSGVEREILDLFRLSFLLCGISPIDLLYLNKPDREGYVTYKRSKTNIITTTRLTPEALEIIEAYKGKDLLLRQMESGDYANYTSFLRRINKKLKLIGSEYKVGAKQPSEPLYPYLSMYYARHTWATFAGELEVPEIIINTSQGRVNDSIASVYVKVTQTKLDEVNRRVIDYALYNNLTKQ